MALNFVSFEFGAFLAVVYVLHWSCRYAGTRKWLLTIASYVFYAVWNWRFCFLMLFVTVNAFVAGHMLAPSTCRRRTAVLAASIGISYVVDVYRGKVEPEPSFVNIALYISFFPQLIAGPIVRASFIMPQIRQPRSFSPAQQAIGVRLLLSGFIYKAAIADTLAQIADPVFAHVDQYDAHALLTATVAFYGQIYFDFAGGSSIRLSVERILCHLDDLGEPWPTRWRPRHPVE